MTWLGWPAAWAGDSRQADLAKLADPACRTAEVARLTDCEATRQRLMEYRWHPCPRREGKPPLWLLTAGLDADFRRLKAPGTTYPVARPEELFGPARAFLEPSLELIHGHRVMMFGAGGAEIHPFGEGDSITRGYVFDFNHDGILERADAKRKSYGPASDDALEVFSLITLEYPPQTVLEVAFNSSAEQMRGTAPWGFECADDDADGQVEIAFGPADFDGSVAERKFVFRWDAATQGYTAGDVPQNAHIRVLKPGESLKQVAKTAVGLGPSEAKPGQADPITPPVGAVPYRYGSLRGATDPSILAFFRGRRCPDRWERWCDEARDCLPHGFWNLPPKAAALALADVNRSAEHRGQIELAVDDRNGVAPPQSGWVVFKSSASGWHPGISRLFALRSGVRKPLLVVTECFSGGTAIGHSETRPPEYGLRVIELTAAEAEFLTSTLFWLDRVRSRQRYQGRPSGSISGSNDGYGFLVFRADGTAPRLAAEGPVWRHATDARWGDDFEPRIAVNLANFLLEDALRDRLGARWHTPAGLEDEQPPQPQADLAAARLKPMREAMAALFTRNHDDPLPDLLLARLAVAAGATGMAEFAPELTRWRDALPPPTAEEQEFAGLAQRFETTPPGLLPRDNSIKSPKDYQRYCELVRQRRTLPGPVLRAPLERALAQLAAAGDPAALKRMATATDDISQWALARLRQIAPEVWIEVLTVKFAQADAAASRYLFATLAAGNPAAALKLLDGMSPAQRAGVRAEATELLLQHDPAAAVRMVPELLAAAAEPRRDDAAPTHEASGTVAAITLQRQEAEAWGKTVGLLAGMPLDATQRDTLTRLLLAEIAESRATGPLGAPTLPDAITALAALPDGLRHAEFIAQVENPGIGVFDATWSALNRIYQDRPERAAMLERFLRHHLTKHHGAMTRVVMLALAHDLRGLAPDFAAVATSGPAVPDGLGEIGGFTNPVGQRYHSAREATAIWTEPDQTTRARLWVALALARPSWFTPGDSPLRLTAAKEISRLPAPERAAIIRALIETAATTGTDPAVRTWLMKLAANE